MFLGSHHDFIDFLKRREAHMLDRTVKKPYSWMTAIKGLKGHLGSQDLSVVFRRAYEWYYGARSSEKVCAQDRIQRDVVDYGAGEPLPEYVFRMYERLVLKLP